MAGWKRTFAGAACGLLLAVLAVAALAATQATPSTAQSAISTQEPEVENNFPDRLTFRIAIESESPVEEVTLRYRISAGSSSFKRAEVTPATAMTAEVVVETMAASSYIPVGTVFTYHFEILTEDGTEFSTEEREYTYLDPRFDWQARTDESFTVFHASDDMETVDTILQTGKEHVQRMSTFLQTELDFPVKIVFYEDVVAMHEALQSSGETFDQRVTTCGVRVARDLVLLNRIECGGNSFLDILRHELTHVVTKQAGEGGFGSLPFWLDEGTAVYSQSDPGEGFRGTFERARDRNTLVSLRQLSRGATRPSDVNLWYGQSWAVVSYLVETYGEDEFAELFATLKDGNTMDGALTAVYGFDLDGLENEFRASLGLPPREPPAEEPAEEEPPATEAPADEAEEPAEEATEQAPPAEKPGEQEGSANQVVTTEDDDTPPIFLISVIVAVMFVALAGILWLYLTLNRKSGSPPPSTPTPPSAWSPPD